MENNIFEWTDRDATGPAYNFADSLDPNGYLSWPEIFNQYEHLINAIFSELYDDDEFKCCYTLTFKTEKDKMLFILKYA